MGQVPAVFGGGFATLDLKLHRAVREPDGQIHRDTISLIDTLRGLERFRELQTSQHTFWGALFWSESAKQPVVNVRTPVRRIDNAFIGGLIATVAVGDLSYLIGDPTHGGDGRYFILVGRDKVLAHRRLINSRGLGLSEERSLPTIKEVDDPVLARIWDTPVRSSRPTGGSAASATWWMWMGVAGFSSIASCVASAPTRGWSVNISRSRMRRATSIG